MKPAVFLDRDGTMIEELGYLTPSCRPRLFPWTIDAIRLLNRAGFPVVVVTNQGGIGRGLYTADFVEQTHRELGERFAAGGARIDCWQFCPHHQEATLAHLRGPCECRKPGLGMINAAARLVCEFDLSASWTVGDQWGDVQLGHALGGRSILVRSGHGALQESAWPADIAPPTLVCDNLIAAAAHILPTTTVLGREF